MPKEYGVDEEAHPHTVPQILNPSPPPSYAALADGSAAIQYPLSGLVAPQHQYTLNISPPALPTAPSSQDDLDSIIRKAQQQAPQLLLLHGATQSFLRRYTKSAVLREEVLLLRSSVDHVWAEGANQRRFVSDSQQLFMQEATVLLASAPPGYPLERLQKLHAQVLEDHERQAEQAQKTREMEVNLSNREYNLQQKEHRLALAAKRIRDILDELTLPGKGASEPSSPPTEASREEFPPLIQHYFDKAGDVTIERERVFNLELDHRDARANRMLAIEQGRPPSMTDEDFQSAFAREYVEAQQVLDEAVRKSELAKAVCLGEGLNPDSYRKPPTEVAAEDSPAPPSDGAEVPNTPSSHPLDDVEQVQVPTDQPTFEPLATMEDSLSLYPPWPKQRQKDATALDERVQNWMQTLTVPDEPAIARSRSVSESRPSAPTIETREDGTLGFSKTALSYTRKQQREIANYIRRLVTDSDGKERPVLLKRSSSESELFVLPTHIDGRRDTLEDLRAFSVRIPRDP